MKVAILGDGSVGKTSLRKRYLGTGFSNNYLPTIGADFSVKQIKIDATTPIIIRVAIWDIAGQPQYQDLATSFYKGSQGALIVYDVTNRSSFENVVHWIDRFKSNITSDTAPIILIGNKIDLDHEISEIDQLSSTKSRS